MQPEMVKDALIRVLQRVQERQGLRCAPLDGNAVPVKILEKFTSKVWPAATTWLARELDITIPKNVHIFGVKNGGPPLTIDQAVALVCRKSQPRTKQAEAAE
jgi:hypothetical protein